MPDLWKLENEIHAEGFSLICGVMRREEALWQALYVRRRSSCRRAWNCRV